jgi:outer membrane PBP1 activator LpoA protein
MKTLILALILTGCATQGCPAKTAQVTLQCRQDIARGLKSKEQCYQEIEQSCP